MGKDKKNYFIYATFLILFPKREGIYDGTDREIYGFGELKNKKSNATDTGNVAEKNIAIRFLFLYKFPPHFSDFHNVNTGRQMRNVYFDVRFPKFPSFGGGRGWCDLRL